MDCYIDILIIYSLFFFCACGGSEEKDEASISKYYINVSPNLELLADGQTAELMISANCSWNIVTNAEWLTVTPTSGANSLNISVTAGKNDSEENRVAIITVKSNDDILERKVTVTQYKNIQQEEPEVESIDMDDIYFHLRGTLGRRYMEAQALSSDEWVGISFDGAYTDGGIYAQCTLHNFNSTSASTGWYEDVITGIAKANKAIQNMSGEQIDRIAQTRYMRAFFTWILMDNYGDTPILNKLLAEDEMLDRSSRAEAARWIESELKAIIDQLPTDVNSSTYGKPTRYAAEALLVKLYINWPVYTANSVTAYNAISYSYYVCSRKHQ